MPQSPACAAAPEALAFYADCLRSLEGSGLPHLLAGTHAVNAYTGMDRPVKDLDVFCRLAITRASSPIVGEGSRTDEPPTQAR